MDILSIMKEKPFFKSYVSGTKEDIINAEEKLKLCFSEEYKKYLTAYGFVTYEGHELTGICKSKRLNVVDVTLDERNITPYIPNDWYVIEQLNIDGIAIWQSSTGEIFQTAPNTNPKKICNSLAEYIVKDE